MVDRDRDATGRARNARPRDAAGRPLPRGAVGVERIPDDLDLAPDEAVTEAQRLLDAGQPFAAHEVLEASWKAAPEAERELWRGVAQLAVGLTHAQRGNARGAVALLDRAARRLRAWQGAWQGTRQRVAQEAAQGTRQRVAQEAAQGTRQEDAQKAAQVVRQEDARQDAQVVRPDDAHGAAPAGLAVAELAAGADRLAARIRRGDLGEVSPADLRPRLRG